MATAAFKSTTKRIPVGATSADDSTSSSSSHHRRSRSLSRPARPLSSRDSDSDRTAPRGKFVNTVRGSGFPEISLDDLAIEFFESANRGRVDSKSSESESTPASSLRRGRSVSRRSSGVGDDRRNSIGGGGKTTSDASSRRRRSLSVVRCQISDSESDLDRSHNSKSRANPSNNDIGSKLMQKSAVSDQRHMLKKSLSQKDLRSYDGYSSHSSVLTDDEGAGVHFKKSGSEKLRAVHAQKKVGLVDMANGLHKAMRKELRHMETDLAAVKSRASPLSSTSGNRLPSDNSDFIQVASSVRRSYESELEQSEKRKQDLLAEIVFEEQRGRELSKIVNELSPTKNSNSSPAKKSNSLPEPPRARKKSNDRSRMSMRLTEEAERYIEDFISNVEDTDISSLDGERSDTSSSIGGLIKPETFSSPPLPRSLPVLMDGITLPWLQWETNNDTTPMATLNKALLTSTPNSATASSTQENLKDQNNHSISSRGSWSPDYLKEYVGKDVFSKLGEVYSNPDESFSAKSKGLRFDIDEYLKVKSNEDFLTERWKQQQRINSGCLLLCNIRLF